MSPLSIRALSFILALSPLSALSACASGKAEPLAPRGLSEASMESSHVAPPIENIQAPLTQLERTEVVTLVEKGFPNFLRKVSIEASCGRQECRPGSQFEGWRIVQVEDKAFFAGVGIGAGDIVTRINEKSIERDTQAYAVFMALKSAPRLDIEYLRGGRPMRLSLPIVGEAKDAVPAKKAPKGGK